MSNPFPWSLGGLPSEPEITEHNSGEESHARRDRLLSVMGECSRTLINATNAMAHVGHLAGEVGPRFPGSEGEMRAADYVSRRLVEAGRPVELQFFDLPNGGRSRNVSIFIPGESHREFVIGAHLDSTADSPGANDNASGVAVLLELAKVFSAEDLPADLRIIFFGGEELVKKNQIHHHFGSRNFVLGLTREEIKSINGMISVDMAGCGECLRVHSTGTQPVRVRDGLIATAAELGLDIKILPSHAASDHESFEQAGVAAAWIGYYRDPENHTPRDTADRVLPENLESIAKVVYNYVMGGL